MKTVYKQFCTKVKNQNIKLLSVPSSYLSSSMLSIIFLTQSLPKGYCLFTMDLQACFLCIYAICFIIWLNQNHCQISVHCERDSERFSFENSSQGKICSLWHCLWLDQIADKFVRFWHSGKQEKYLQDIKTGSQNVKDCYCCDWNNR